MPEHKVELKPFRIERTEVTNAQFAEYLNALGRKLIGTQLSGRMNPENIPAEHRAMLIGLRCASG